MKKPIVSILVVVAGLFCGSLAAQEIIFGTGNAVGGNNVDNLAFSAAGNIVTLAVTLTDGGVLQISVPSTSDTGARLSPQQVARTILNQLDARGGASAGPLAMAILEGVTGVLGGAAAGSQ